MSFQSGDKVVTAQGPHVNNPNKDVTPFDTSKFKVTGLLPRAGDGKVYVVRGTILGTYNVLGLQLIGCTIIHLPTGSEVGWDSRSFRKLDELKQEALQRQSQSA